MARIFIRLLKANLRRAELQLLFIALVLAITLVTGIRVFTERLDLALLKQSHGFIAADLVISGNEPIPETWQKYSQSIGLATASISEFASMVFANEKMHLASVKAITPGYPLVGDLEISKDPFSINDDEIKIADSIPSPGEVWVDSRLLEILSVSIGDELEVGDTALKITQVVIREPDGNGLSSFFGARVLINMEDLAKANLISPGSRVNYRWLMAGEEVLLANLQQEILPKMTVAHRFLTIENSQQQISNALQRSTLFLLLAGLVGVLLAAITIVVSAERFARLQVDQVAVLKTLGCTKNKIRMLYLLQIGAVLFAATVIALPTAFILQESIVYLLKTILAVKIPSISVAFYFYGLSAPAIALFLLLFPFFMHLTRVSAMKILRSDLLVSQSHWLLRILLILVALLMLIIIYGGPVRMTLSMVLGLIILMALGMMVAWGCFFLLGKLLRHRGRTLRLVGINLKRHRSQSLLQVCVFSIAFMLLAMLYLIRNGLIDQWQDQLPENTPNHFLLNISTEQVVELKKIMVEKNIQFSDIYPVVRGRLVSINDRLPTEDQYAYEVMEREANLSWVSNLREDNKIIAGKWWDKWTNTLGGDNFTGKAGVSVEADLAERLGLNLGDKLSFNLGGLTLDAEVVSFRKLKWDSMQPNFYFLFSPNALASFSPMYLTSMYVSTDQKPFIAEIIKRWPSLVIIEMDKVINRIQAIISQVSRTIELVLWLVLFGGTLVLISTINATLDTRMRETAIFRMLGGQKKFLLTALSLEYCLIGSLSGFIGALGAQSVLLGLQRLLDLPVSFYPYIWVITPILATLLISLIGVLAVYKVIDVSPMITLKNLD